MELKLVTWFTPIYLWGRWQCLVLERACKRVTSALPDVAAILRIWVQFPWIIFLFAYNIQQNNVKKVVLGWVKRADSAYNLFHRRLNYWHYICGCIAQISRGDREWSDHISTKVNHCLSLQPRTIPHCEDVKQLYPLLLNHHLFSGWKRGRVHVHVCHVVLMWAKFTESVYLPLVWGIQVNIGHYYPLSSSLLPFLVTFSLQSLYRYSIPPCSFPLFPSPSSPYPLLFSPHTLPLYPHLRCPFSSFHPLPHCPILHPTSPLSPFLRHILFVPFFLPPLLPIATEA